MMLDPVTLEILWTRLVSMVDEAAAAFVRTSFSTLVRESNDYAVLLADTQGRSLAQSSRSIPPFIGTLPATIRHFLQRYPLKSLAAEDAIITNDPWLGTGHLPDISMAMPIFHKGKAVGFVGVVSHMPDIGGRLWNSGIRELYEEGLQIPPLKFLSAGEPNQALLALIERNVRVPEQTMGDLWGQVACCRMLTQRVTALLDETGEDLGRVGAQIADLCERAMRTAIRAIPDGDYCASITGDGFEDPLEIRCCVAIAGEDLLVDYAGSSPQLARSINTVPAYGYAYSAFAVKAMLTPGVPNNDGSFRPVHVTAPEGSILNPRYPAACGARGMVGQLLPPAIMAALADVLPDRVQAAPGSPQCSFTLSGESKDRRFTAISFVAAGMGAGAQASGLPAVSFPGNVANTPIEVMEAGAPLRVRRRALRRGSGGIGRQRGGDGQSLEFELLGDVPAVASFIMNRLRVPAFGLAAGGSGGVARLAINDEDIDPARHWVLRPGDRVLIETAAGGGYGAPSNEKDIE